MVVSLLPTSVQRVAVIAFLLVVLLRRPELSQAQQQQQQQQHQQEVLHDPSSPPKPSRRRTTVDGSNGRNSYPQPTADDLDAFEQATHNQANTDNTDNTLDQKRKLLAPFDTDIRKDCRAILTHCQSDIFSHAYLQCPAMCTKYLEQEGMKGTADQNPEGLWDVGTLRTHQGRRIDADRFEGYVTVICILPMLPGMAFYYYEMMETLHSQFDPKVEFVILPIDVGEGIHIKIRDDTPKVVILEEESAIETHPWVKHLTSIRPRSGAAMKDHLDRVVQVDLPTDRLTVYVVSSDGYFVERMTVPTMAALQRTIAMYLQTIDYDEL
jgi:hypothetical protein